MVVDVEVDGVRRLIDGLRRDRRVHPYHGRREYSQTAQAVAASCEALLEVDPGAVVGLTRRAVERVTATLMYMDDSSGVVGVDLRVLMAVHARACALAGPDPKRLAGWLAKLRLDGPGWPDFELRDYAEALGEKGRGELARIVAERAAVVDQSSFDSFGIRILREQLAEISGDIDNYIAVLAEPPFREREYVKIVEVLVAASRAEEAEEWARRGLFDGPGHPIELRKLRDAYVELLLGRGAVVDAVAFRREQFDRHPTHANYRDLHNTADQVGVWDEQRDSAIEHLRGAVAEKPGFVDELIKVLLDGDDTDTDAVWRVAVEYADHLTESRWLGLIELRQCTHPVDVVEPLQRLIEQRLGMSGDKYRYDKAVKLIQRLRDAHRAAGDLAEFALYLTDLRDRHKRKTAFLARLDRAQLPASPI